MPKLSPKRNEHYSDKTDISVVIYAQNLLNKGYAKPISNQYTSKTLTTCRNDISPMRIIHGESPRHFRNQLNRITYGDVTIRFQDGISLDVDISYEDGLYIAFNDRFGVYGSGITYESAYEDFKDSFVDFYEDVMNLPEESVGESTIKLRNSLRQFTSYFKK